jgi:PKD repeat protein
METKAKFLTFLLITFLFLNAGTPLFSPAVSQPIAVVSVDPPKPRADFYVNQNYTININVTNVANLNLWELKLGFSFSVLDIVKMEEGPFLKDLSGTFGGPFNTVFKTSLGVNYVLLGCLINSADTVSGNGTLATVTFKVVDTGESNLDPYDVKLQDASGNQITLGSPVGGVFYTVQPKASFYYLPQPPSPELPPDTPTGLQRNPIAGETVTFNASSSYATDGRTIASYQWNFGDGNTTTATNPLMTHIFTTPQTYTINLTVIDNASLTNSQIKQVSVVIHDIAITNITVTKTTVYPGTLIYINMTISNRGTVTEDLNASLLYETVLIPYDNRTTPPNYYYWSSYSTLSPIGGPPPNPDPLPASPDPESNRTITFAWNTTGVADGQYQLWANASLMDSKTRKFLLDLYPGVEKNLTNNVFTFGNITIFSEATANPIASFTFPNQPPDNIPLAGQPAKFDASASHAFQGRNIINYQWNFGDSNTTNVTYPIINHTYTGPGNYWVTLTVTDNSSLTGSTQPTQVKVYYHNINITDVAISRDTLQFGETLYIYVQAKNEGDFPEFFNVTVFLNTQQINASWTGKNTFVLNPGIGGTATLNWTVTGVPAGTYTLKVSTTPVPYEFNLTDNTKTWGSIAIIKQYSTLTISAAASIIMGQSLTISGQLTPSRSGAPVTIQSKIAGGTWSNLTTVTTSLSSQYSYKWTPSTAGTYQIKSIWLGDTYSFGNESTTTATVAVNKAVSTLFISISTTSLKVGSSIVINGTVNPKRVGINVVIQVRVSGGTWTDIATVQTDSNSHYTYTWNPTAKGTYDVKAKWDGDANTVGDESDLQTLTVAEAPTPPSDLSWLIPYAAVGIIVIIALAGVYFLKIRKPKTLEKT